MSAVIDIGQMLTNLQAAFGSLQSLIVSFSYVFGVFLLVKALLKSRELANHNPASPQQGSFKDPIMLALVGGMLVYLPSSVNMGLNTIFASTELGTASSLLSYTPSMDSQTWSQIQDVLVEYLKLLGFIAFIRGWIILSKAGEGGQQDTMSKGVIHVVAGILLINIVDSIQILASTFGFVGFSSTPSLH
jgi:intracellular multiplication protein IcmC